MIALDIGANIGIHSVVLSSEVGEGRVYSFEAQRVVFNMLVGNIALNSLENVFCYHNAVSNQNELIPKSSPNGNKRRAETTLPEPNNMNEF